MKCTERFLRWFVFPIKRPELEPSLLWYVVFILSFPFVIIHAFYRSFEEDMQLHRMKRLKFKEEYQKYINEEFKVME